MAVIADTLHQSANTADIDDAIAGHAAIQQQIIRRHQPVTDMKRQNAFFAGTGDFGGEVRIPPDVINIQRDPQPIIASTSQTSLACAIVLMQARSAAMTLIARFVPHVGLKISAWNSSSNRSR